MSQPGDVLLGRASWNGPSPPWVSAWLAGVSSRTCSLSAAPPWPWPTTPPVTRDVDARFVPHGTAAAIIEAGTSVSAARSGMTSGAVGRNSEAAVAHQPRGLPMAANAPR